MKTNKEKRSSDNSTQISPGEKTTKKSVDSGGYEPVETQTETGPTIGRSPSSKLPRLPSDQESEPGTPTGCFPMRKSRSNSREKKAKKSFKKQRSPSRISGCSEHNYETPKLLQKFSKTSSEKKEEVKTDLDDGYEPVGQPLTMESWVAEKESEFNNLNIDKDVRSVGGTRQHEVIVTESDTGKIIFKETLSQENLDVLDKDDSSFHLDRNS